MKLLGLAGSGDRLSVLCIGADRGVRLDVHSAVLSACGPRAAEARASAETFLAGAARSVVDLAEFKDGVFPYQGADIKIRFESLKRRAPPELILFHSRNDEHQDHREVSMLTWNTFRDHAILEYEIPERDDDLGQPNVLIPASGTPMGRTGQSL
jgi:LmbE family N-acetylglucosaminyl deacetylase